MNSTQQPFRVFMTESELDTYIREYNRRHRACKYPTFEDARLANAERAKARKRALKQERLAQSQITQTAIPNT